MTPQVVLDALKGVTDPDLGIDLVTLKFVKDKDIAIDGGDGSDIWVDKIRIGVNGGSHHANIFRVRTIVMLDGAPGDVVRHAASEPCNGQRECRRHLFLYLLDLAPTRFLEGTPLDHPREL